MSNKKMKQWLPRAGGLGRGGRWLCKPFCRPAQAPVLAANQSIGVRSRERCIAGPGKENWRLTIKDPGSPPRRGSEEGF